MRVLREFESLPLRHLLLSSLFLSVQHSSNNIPRIISVDVPLQFKFDPVLRAAALTCKKSVWDMQEIDP